MKIEVDEIMTELPQTVPEPFRTTAERIVKAEQDKCFGEMNGCIRNIRNGDCGQAGGSLVDAITHALEDAAGALLSRTSDETARAFARLFPDYKQAGFTGGQAADFEILKRALSLSRPHRGGDGSEAAGN